MTAEELLGYLQHSKIPTLLLEGTGDRAVLRRFEQELSASEVDIFPVGGKCVLHAVYLRRDELGDAKIAFLRDRDEFALVDLPPEFSGYLVTSGYSIENDLIDRTVIERLAAGDAASLSALVALMADWFRYVLQDYVSNGKRAEICRDITAVLDGSNYTDRSKEEMARESLAEPFASLDLQQDSWRWLRGKTLLRTVQHYFVGKSPSYSKDQLVDLSLKLGPSAAFSSLKSAIRERLA